MLRIAMSSIMRCLSGEIGVVIGQLRRRFCTCSADDRTDGRDDLAQGYVAEVILCDVSRMALLSHIARPALTRPFGVLRCDAAMTKSRSQQLSEKADDERRRCCDWLLRFMQNNQPKFLTKDELRGATMRELTSRWTDSTGCGAAMETRPLSARMYSTMSKHGLTSPLRK